MARLSIPTSAPSVCTYASAASNGKNTTSVLTALNKVTWKGLSRHYRLQVCCPSLWFMISSTSIEWKHSSDGLLNTSLEYCHLMMNCMSTLLKCCSSEGIWYKNYLFVFYSFKDLRHIHKLISQLFCSVCTLPWTAGCMKQWKHYKALFHNC